MSALHLVGKADRATPDIIGDNLDGAIERGVAAGKAENAVNTVVLTEVHHFGAAVMAIATNGNSVFGQFCRMWRASRRR